MPSLNKVLCLLLALTLTACATPTPPPAPTATPLPTPTLVPTPDPKAVYVDPGLSLGPISPYIYGSNYGPWVSVSLAMLPLAQSSGITILRFPGGEHGDNFDISRYQIDQFMAFSNRMGAQATFSVRLKNGTPEQAAEMVRFVNLERQCNLRYWSIGNEPNLYTQALQRTYDTAEFNIEWRKIALAMRAVDKNILLMGPELNQYGRDPANQPKDSLGKDWMIEFLRANGDLVDVITIHRYPYPRNQTNATIADLRANSSEWDQTLPYLRELIRTETGRDLPIAVTEINSHWSKAVSGEATPDSHYSAIWLADVLGRMIRNGVFMVNQFALASKGGLGSWGLVNPDNPYPSYYVYQLYKKFGNELVASSSPDPDLSIYAAKRSDGALTLIIINLADGEKRTPLYVQGRVLTQAEAWLFDPTHLAENLGTLDFSAGTLTLPPQSMTLLILAGK